MSRDRMLTAKQARFIAEYLVDLNASEAAIRAGYRLSSARQTASRLLQMRDIRAEVQRLQAEQLNKAGITAEAVLEQIRRVAFFDVAAIYESVEVAGERQRRLMHPADWPAGARAALANFDARVRSVSAGDGLVDTVVKVKLNDRLRALELLAKHLGLLVDKQEHDSHVTISWLPPEPPPSPPQIETIDARRDPTPPSRWLPAGGDPEEQMGFSPTPPGPSDRTRPQSFSDSYDRPPHLLLRTRISIARLNGVA